MPSDYRSHPGGSARERVAARRAARRSQRSRIGCGPQWVALAVGLTAIVLLIIQIGSSWARETLQRVEQYDPRQTDAQAQNGDVPARLDAPFTILLIGVDRRPDLQEGVRSDTLILVHVNPGAAWAGMLSIPRDSVVEVPHLGLQKINTAYAYGFNHASEIYGPNTPPEAAGSALAAETVEGFLGLAVDYTAEIDFAGFERVVDTLGGIRIDVPRPLLDPAYPSDDYGYERLYVPAGLQVLDGATALRYARSRHSSSDFDRSRRQQQVLRAILSEVQARGMLNQASLLPALVEDLEQSVRTTLPLSDLDTLRGLANLAQRLAPDRIVQLSINPNDVAVIQEIGSDIYWDQGDLSLLVARLLAGSEGSSEVARIQVQNGAGVPGLAGRITERLRRQGFVMAEPTDALVASEQTRVIDYGNHPQTLQRIAELLQIDAHSVYQQPPPDAPAAPYQADIVLILGSDYRE